MYNVLIVDDEKVIRIGMRAIIDWEDYGFIVAGIVSDGEQALQVIQEQDIHLVITDIKMPKMDGIQLVKALKALEFAGEIIMLTSYGEFDLARECLRLGVHDYLLKGTLRQAELIQALDGVRPRLKKIVQQLKEEIVEENTKDYHQIVQIATQILKGEAVTINRTVFSTSYQFVLMKYISSKLEQSTNKEKTLSQYQVAIRNIIVEVLPNTSKPLIVFEGDWCLCSLPLSSGASYHEVHQLSLQIQNLIKLYTNIKVIGVIGRLIYTSDDLADSIKKCMKVAEMAFYTGYQDVLKEENEHYRKEIIDIMSYVEEHIGEKIALATIANQVNMNESYISRLFKNETGLNIINYVNIRKMEKAKELLREKNMIVKDVAYALGFDEQSYFNRMFNKYFGLNPKEYKQCTNNQNHFYVE